jgi:hypothetical protein
MLLVATVNGTVLIQKMIDGLVIQYKRQRTVKNVESIQAGNLFPKIKNNG